MRFYGQHQNPQVDEYLYNTFFKGKKNGFFIEAGAHDGVYDSSCRSFEQFLGWKGINIEADAGLFSLLKRNRPNSLNLHLGLSSQENSGNELEFTTTVSTNGTNPGHGGFSIPKSRVDNFCKTTKLFKVLVPSKSVKDLLSDLKIEKVDLFVLDVEGHEVEVITGMEGGCLPRVVCVEYPISGLDRIKKAITPLGYTFHSVVHNNAHFTLEEIYGQD